MTPWPRKDQREQLEVEGFIAACAQLPQPRHLQIVAKGEAPDYVVRDVATGTEYGVELTSVYVDDRSVPDHHIPEQIGPVLIPDDRAEIERYLERLLEAIAAKIKKARKGYRQDRPLVLSILINEYIAIWLDNVEIDRFVRQHESFFDDMTPFGEIVFWSRSTRIALSVTPSAGLNG